MRVCLCVRMSDQACKEDVCYFIGFSPPPLLSSLLTLTPTRQASRCWQHWLQACCCCTAGGGSGAGAGAPPQLQQAPSVTSSTLWSWRRAGWAAAAASLAARLLILGRKPLLAPLTAGP